MREWRGVWGCCPGIGSVRLAALEALAASKQLSLAHLCRWPLHRLAEELSWPERVWNQLDRYRQHCGIHPTCDIPANALLQGDQNWPEPLNALEAAPLCLFYRGDTLLLQALQRRKAVAVVGTRSPSTHGVQMVDRLGRALGRAGWLQALMRPCIGDVWPWRVHRSPSWAPISIVSIQAIIESCSL